MLKSRGRGGSARGGFIPKHGGYRRLLSYRKTLIIYDGTVLFCERFLDPRDRTVDQMVQAARSGSRTSWREALPPPRPGRRRSG